MEFGGPRTGTHLTEAGASIDADEITANPFRWNLVRQYDRRGGRNLAVYSWLAIGGRKYLRHIHYTPPATGWSSAALSEFAYHVDLSWENPSYSQTHYTHQDKRRPAVRLRRVAVLSKTWSAAGDREFLRAYNLSYLVDRDVPGASNEAPIWNRSFLREIKAEPRCAATEIDGLIPDTNCVVPPPISTTFEYQQAELSLGATMVQSSLAPSGFGEFGNLPYPAQARVVDINRDGFPDILQSWPQNFEGGNYRIWLSECFENDTDNHVDDWFHIREAPGQPRPFNPQLVCHRPPLEEGGDPEEIVIRSARVHSAYVNRGHAAVAGVTLQHNCLDAGDGGTGTLTKYQVTPPGTTAPTSNPAALFSQWGAEVYGPFGDALMLWSRADYQGFRIMGTAANTSFCSQATGDPTYPALRWSETGIEFPDWVRQPLVPQDPALGMVDIDGDGYPDRLGASGTGFHDGLRQATVQLTRRISKLDTTFQPVIGPALVPFAASPEASPTAAGAAGGKRVYYADVNGDGLVDLVATDPAVDGGRHTCDPEMVAGTSAVKARPIPRVDFPVSAEAAPGSAVPTGFRPGRLGALAARADERDFPDSDSKELLP